MMLVQLPAMDAVSTTALPSLSLGRFVPPSLAMFARPSAWLTLLATLVILSSIRAALLYVRPPPSTAHKATVSLAQETTCEKTALTATTTTTTPTGTTTTTTTILGSSTTTTTAITTGTTGLPTDKPQTQTTSWLWGLVKWDALPALPDVRVQGRHWRPMSRQHRQQQQQGQQQVQMQQHALGQQPQTGRRSPGPAFDHPLPALYQSGTPVSMAKMIMSRHTFRRPTSRPPPVRSANAVQYQRRSPSMV